MADQNNPYNGYNQNPYGQVNDPYGAQGANQYGQPQGQYNAPQGADPYGQGQFNAQNPYGQGQYADQNPYGQSQVQNQYNQQFTNNDMYGQQNPYSQPQYNGGYPGNTALAKKNGAKMAIIIVASLLVVAGLAVGAYFLFFKDKKDDETGSGMSPKELAEEFIDAFEAYDTDRIADLFPPELAADDEVTQIKTMFQQYSSAGIELTFEDVEYDVEESYSDSELKQLKSTLEDQGYNISSKLKDAKNIKITCEMKVSYMGETQSQKNTMRLVAGKINGEWKLVGLIQ